jgi:GNAT superfamily N-acetyltransferase
MVKKDGFKDEWCENRSVSKCKSRKRIWNDNTIPTTEYKHSNACRMKKNRDIQKNEAERYEENNLGQLRKVTERSNCNLTKRIINKKDFKVDYSDPMRKGNLEKSNPGNNFLKPYENRAEQELLEEEITVSKVIQFTNDLEKVGMHICLAEEIRKIKTSESESLIALYRQSFSEFDKNPAMLSWVKNCTKYGLFHYNRLIAGVSFKRIEIENLKRCYQVLLLGVWKEHRRKNNGTKLMKNLMESCESIVLWSDLTSIKFYEKLGFKMDKGIQELTKHHVIEESNSVFLCWGFDDQEEEELLSWELENQEFQQYKRNI